MTTDDNKSVLKSKLGLENLKGLGDTLQQIKEVKTSLDEAQKTISDLAKENSPLGNALARLVEAQGLKALNEDNVSVSEEVRKKMAEELQAKEKTIEQLGEKNKELTEDKVVHEVTSKLTAELDKRLPQPGKSNDTGQGKLMNSLEKVVADYMEKRLLGSGDAALTADQIRSVIKEEVAAGAGGKKKPEDMIDDLVNALTIGDKLKERLGVAGIGERLIQGKDGDSGLRTDLVKALLEDERERLKITQQHEVDVQRNQHLGTMAGAIKDNLSDGVAALTAAAEEGKGGPGTKTSKTEPPPQVFACGDCHSQFSPRADWAGQSIKCPNPACGRIYTQEELIA